MVAGEPCHRMFLGTESVTCPFNGLRDRDKYIAMFTADHLFRTIASLPLPLLRGLVGESVWKIAERRKTVLEGIVWMWIFRIVGIYARTENNHIFLHVLDNGGDDYNDYANPEQERHFRIPQMFER